MKVALFVTCVNDMLYPQVGRATVEVLERLGHSVVFPERQTCCGQMHTNTGYWQEALPIVANHVDAFEAALADGATAIVTPSGSCAGSVRHQHDKVAAHAGDDRLAARAAAVASRTFELSQFLVDELGITDVGATFPHRVTYHPTCHSVRMLGLTDQPVRLLREVRGIDLVELPAHEQCCGFGGTFALKNSDTSTAMLADKMASVRSTRAEVLTAGDSSCLMHIGGGLTRLRTGVKVMHLAEILAAQQ